MPTEAINPACPNGGGTNVTAPGVVGNTYGGVVCPAPGGGGGAGGSGAVYGNDVTGSAPSKPPVYFGGIGATDGYIHGILTDSSGREYVDVYSLPPFQYNNAGGTATTVSPTTPLPVTPRYDQQTITLAFSQAIAAGGYSTPQTIPISATYGFAYVLSGTSPSVILQTLGPDGATYVNGPTVTASGSQAVVIFAGASGATVRLYNAGANSVTITAKLAS